MTSLAVKLVARKFFKENKDNKQGVEVRSRVASTSAMNIAC